MAREALTSLWKKGGGPLAVVGSIPQLLCESPLFEKGLGNVK